MVTILYFAMVLAVLVILSLVFVQIEKDVGVGFSLKPLKIRMYAKSGPKRANFASKPDTRDWALTTVANQTIADQTIQVDGRIFRDCAFENCTLVYSGQTPASFAQCRFTAVKWQVTAAAKDVLEFLGGIYRNGGESGKEWVKEALAEITRQEGSQPL